MLEVLVRNPEKLVTQQQLLSEVWGPAYAKETNYLRVYMAQLRRKLEPEAATPAAPDHRGGNRLPVHALTVRAGPRPAYTNADFPVTARATISELIS